MQADECCIVQVFSARLLRTCRLMNAALCKSFLRCCCVCARVCKPADCASSVPVGSCASAVCVCVSVDRTIDTDSVYRSITDTKLTLANHKLGVLCVDFNQDGTTLVSGSIDRTIKVWSLGNVKSTAVIMTLTGHKKCVNSVKISPDTQKIASASWDSTVVIWNARSGTKVHTFTGHTSGASCVAWSSDSRLIASGGGDKKVYIWDLLTGAQVMGPLIGHNHTVTSVAFNGATSMLISASWDKSIIIWKLSKRGGLDAQYMLHGKDFINSVCWMNEDKFIASACSDGTVRLWDARKKEVVKVFAAHGEEVLCTAAMRNSMLVVVAVTDGTVRVWCMKDQVCMYVCVECMCG